MSWIRHTRGQKPFTQPLADWAKSMLIGARYAAKLARDERIVTPDNQPGVKKIEGEWYAIPGSWYDFKPMGGKRPGAGRKKPPPQTA